MNEVAEEELVLMLLGALHVSTSLACLQKDV